MRRLEKSTSRQLISIELPKALSGYRIINHHNNSFLLADNYSNTIFARTKHIVICQALQDEVEKSGTKIEYYRLQ